MTSSPSLSQSLSSSSSPSPSPLIPSHPIPIPILIPSHPHSHPIPSLPQVGGSGFGGSGAPSSAPGPPTLILALAGINSPCADTSHCAQHSQCQGPGDGVEWGARSRGGGSVLSMGDDSVWDRHCSGTGMHDVFPAVCPTGTPTPPGGSGRTVSSGSGTGRTPPVHTCDTHVSYMFHTTTYMYTHREQ